jgi:hypothetical protein
MWDMPLWNDNGSYFKAPSIRSIAEIAVQAVSAVGAAALLPFTGGASMLAYAGFSAAINMVDDAVFAALDAAGGYKDGLEVGVAFAKKAATSFVSGLVSAGFSGINIPGLEKITGLTEKLTGGIDNSFLQTLAKTGMTGVQSMTTGTISSVINSVSYTRGIGFGFSTDTLMSGLDGAWKSAVASSVGTFTSGMLEEINLKDGNSLPLNGYTFDTANIQKLNSFTGSIASSAVTYGLTGNTVLNLAKLSGSIGGGQWSTGVLEMNLGEDGFSLGIGSGGTDISIETIAGAMEGVKDAGKVTAAKVAALVGRNENISTLNAVNMLGWTGKGFEQYISKEIWEGKQKVGYEDFVDEDTKGMYEIRGGKIVINKNLLGGGKEGSAKLAAVMSHEGTHAVGNRIEGMAYLRGNSTYEAVKAVFGLEGDAEFSAEMAAAIFDKESWKVNTGNTDYWLVKKNGDIFDDGKDGEISFEDGRDTIYTNNKGKQGSLEEYLGLEKGEGYKLLMKGAGFVYNADTKTWTTGGKTISGSAIKALIDEWVVTETETLAEPELPSADVSGSGQSFMKRVSAAAVSLWNGITTGAGAVGNFFGGLLKKKDTQAQVKEVMSETNELQNNDYNKDYILTKELLDNFATPKFYEKYKAQVKTKTDDPLDQLVGLKTQCNTFIDALIKGFGDDVYKDIMPNGSQSPNELYITWNTNPNLLQLKNGNDAWEEAQKYADKGYIVLSAASDDENHVAFLLPNWGYQYQTLPDTDWKQREGYKPRQGEINYSGEMKRDWPAFLQSGSYTGIVEPRWAYSSDIIENGCVYFYVYYKGDKK